MAIHSSYVILLEVVEDELMVSTIDLYSVVLLLLLLLVAAGYNSTFKVLVYSV